MNVENSLSIMESDSIFDADTKEIFFDFVKLGYIKKLSQNSFLAVSIYKKEAIFNTKNRAKLFLYEIAGFRRKSNNNLTLF